jgi:hypothetical protein
MAITTKVLDQFDWQNIGDFKESGRSFLVGWNSVLRLRKPRKVVTAERQGARAFQLTSKSAQIWRWTW